MVTYSPEIAGNIDSSDMHSSFVFARFSTNFGKRKAIECLMLEKLFEYLLRRLGSGQTTSPSHVAASNSERSRIDYDILLYYRDVAKPTTSYNFYIMSCALDKVSAVARDEEQLRMHHGRALISNLF
eukprot:scaffold5885_cov201-Amphora_coffeaeformis.AAC.4